MTMSPTSQMVCPGVCHLVYLTPVPYSLCYDDADEVAIIYTVRLITGHQLPFDVTC